MYRITISRNTLRSRKWQDIENRLNGGKVAATLKDHTN